MSKHLLPSEGVEGRSIARRILQVLDGDVASGLLGGLVERSDRGNFKQILSKIEAQLGSAIASGEFGSISLEDRTWSEQLLFDVLAELATHIAGSTEFHERFLVDALKGPYAVAPHLRSTAAFVRVANHTEHSLGARSALVYQTDVSRYTTLSIDLLAHVLSEWVKANGTIAHRVTNAALGAIGRDLDGIKTDVEVTAARVERPLASEIVRGYRRTIVDRAPGVLLHRERELQKVQSLRTEYHFGWSGVEKAGKSGLAYTIARNGLEWAHVVPFFVSRYESGSNDRGSFAYVTGAYLAEIAGEPYGPSDSPGRDAEFRWRELLRHAAFVARKADMRLVLLVDGLDEDVVLSNDTRVGSIAALLPSTEECVALGVRVVATARPNPPLPHDVPKDHWLHRPDAWLELAESAVAKDSLDSTEIHELMRDPVGRDISAFLACSGAPLTIADLGFVSEHTPARIEEVLSQQRSRNLVRVRLASGQPAFILGHQETHVEVVRNLDPSLWDIGNLRDDPSWSRVRAAALQPFVDKLLSAAARLADREWSHSPPYFLSSAFVDGLIDGAHFGHAIQFAQDPRRIQAIVEREGSAYSAAAQISSVADSWPIESYADLKPLANLFFFRNQFARAQLTVPAGTSAAHAGVGDVDVAFRIARGVPNAVHRASELIDLGDALREMHNVSRAIEAYTDAVDAASKAYGPLRDNLVVDLAGRLAESGETEQALNCVRLAEKSSVRYRGLRSVADLAWQRGDWHALQKIEPRLTAIERARMWLRAEFAGVLPPEETPGHGRRRAAALATKIAGNRERAELWSEIAAGEMNDEARDRATSFAIAAANAVTSAAGRAAAWIAISGSRRTTAEREADLERARSLTVASGQAPREVDQTLARIGREYAPLNPAAIEDCLAMISTSKGRARAWTDIACDHARNGSSVSSEEAVARITIARARDDAWCALASAWAGRGDYVNAWKCVNRISRRSVKNVALIRLAVHAARCGSVEQLERVAGRISGEPHLQANAKMLLARVKGLRGDLEGARDEIRDARKLQSASWWPSPGVLPSLVQSGKAESAIGLVLPLPDGRARDTSLVVIATSSAERGDFDSALRALEHCGSRVTGGPGWAAVAAEYAKRGLIAAASDAVVKASPRSRARVWGEVAAAHIRDGDLQAASAIAVRTSPVLRQADVWAAIGAALASEGKLEEARHVVGKIPSGARRARAWLALAAVINDRNDRGGLVSDAAGEVHSLPSAETRAELWRSIAMHHVNDARMDRALVAMEEAALAAARMADPHALAVHWIETAELYALISEGTESDDAIRKAEMFIQRTAIPELRASAWCLVADHHHRHADEPRASVALATAWLTTSDSTFGWQVFEMIAPAASAELLDSWSAEVVAT